MTATEEMEAQAAVQSVIDRWAAAVRNIDMDGIMANHANDILMYDAVAPFQLNGLEAYRKAWELFFKYSKGGEGSFNLSEVKITAGGNVAFATATVNIFALSIRLTMGFRKEKGQWLIAHEHHSGLEEK